ncbi:hypothetical protein CTAYLR_006374 [Chrysophaeum taylorii]|uniref:Generic methyltransferase n=1 Tax=Chrysophaeum taylorii TaxID=2483200 RepID=A0AAD7U6J3_9STRA|nr:hypothetical protein CTAYLR_006374 [Chrysophaeum taylorii]
MSGRAAALVRAIVRRSGAWGCGDMLGERAGRGRGLSASPRSAGDSGVEVRSLAPPRLELRGASLREELEKYFENGWALTEALFAGLRDERAFYEPAAHGLRHPLIFYYGHPAALAINKLRVGGLREGPLHAEFERLFETGVDEMRWDDVVSSNDNKDKWPELDEVCDYRARAREVVIETIRKIKNDDDDNGAAAWCIAMICEHERIHLETSSVLVREMDLGLVRRPAEWPADHPSAFDNNTNNEKTTTTPRFYEVEGMTVNLGKSKRDTYGWDNEFGSRRVSVENFECSNLVTNSEFLEFVKAGGYRDPTLWDEAGWGWRTFRNAKWPHFWVPSGPAGLDDYKLRLVFEEVDLPPALPAEVNAHEGRAYARWLERRDNSTTYRMITEAEHYVVRERVGKVSLSDPSLDRRDAEACEAAGVNLNLAWGSPSAVSPNRLEEPAGNVWHWCEDDFAALPGFAPDPLYDDFSTPCFDGQHTVIHGGSFASTGNETSVYARFHFRPHFHQHAGVRLARTAKAARPPELTSYDPAPPLARGWIPQKYADVLGGEGKFKYESESQLEAYLGLHFGGSRVLAERGSPTRAFVADLEFSLDFPRRCAEAVPGGGESFLDVGCAVGGACFAAASKFDKIVGIDYSRKFVETATTLAAGATVKGVSLGAAKPNCRFLVGDASDPETLQSLGTFDAVLAANLLCRLPKPSAFLEALPNLVSPRGHVLLVSPYSFMPEYTPEPAEWLDPDTLKAKMAGLGFDLRSDSHLPLLIKDHARKFQLIFSNALLFQQQRRSNYY